jgi:hypothetical protein
MNDRLNEVTVLIYRMLAAQWEREERTDSIELERLQENFSLGYIYGFTDAHSQRLGIDDDSFIKVLAGVVENVLSPRDPDGLRETVENSLKWSEDPIGGDFCRGMQLGGDEVNSWIRSGSKLEFVSGDGSNSALNSRAVVGGDQPRILARYLADGEDSLNADHECEWCNFTSSKLLEKVQSLLPAELNASEAIVATYGCGVDIKVDDKSIGLLGRIAVIEQHPKTDSLRGCCLTVRIPALGALDPMRPSASLPDALAMVQEILQRMKFARKAQSGSREGMSANEPLPQQATGCAVFAGLILLTATAACGAILA